MTVKVLEPGFAATIQDLGRPGFYQMGIPIGGAMDRLALRAGNLLVGNEESAAVLECPFIGPKLEFQIDTIMSVTGAELPISLDGQEYPGWSSIEVRAGQTLEFGYLRKGARIYIAVSGGFDVPSVLGSRSTYLVGQLGGLFGRMLEKDDLIRCFDRKKPNKLIGIPDKLRRPVRDVTELRAVPGLFWHRLTEEAGVNFFKDQWKVSTEADRMGYRFSGGRAMEFVDREQPFGAGADPSNIVDSPYPYGSIQVPSGLEPIVLHRDAVSAGGYFQIGAVISADMDLIGQLQPNKSVNFARVDMDGALSARAEEESRLEVIRSLF